MWQIKASTMGPKPYGNYLIYFGLYLGMSQSIYYQKQNDLKPIILYQEKENQLPLKFHVVMCSLCYVWPRLGIHL